MVGAVLHVLATMGVVVLEVPEMIKMACYVQPVRVGLIRADLTPDVRAAALDYLWLEASQSTAPPCPQP